MYSLFWATYVFSVECICTGVSQLVVPWDTMIFLMLFGGELNVWSPDEKFVLIVCKTLTHKCIIIKF